MKFTKIIATIGPDTKNTTMLTDLIEAGVNVYRLNFSHGDHAWHIDAIKKVRQVSNRVAVMLDTKGPEIRTDILDVPLNIKKGQTLILSSVQSNPENYIVKHSYKDLSKDVKVGDTILIDDGNIELKVISKNKNEIKTTSISNTVLGSRKSLVVPKTKINLPDLTRKDIKDIELGIRHNVDFIALSLVKNAETVIKVKNLVKRAKKNISVLAKIEHPEGFENIDEIISVSDGIMVARGDLGLSMRLEEVPLVQKKIIDKCNKAGKPVIVATQMLESMTKCPRPTRAEASDVANAILDGADCVMLSGETANGSFPVQAVKTMARIIKITDPHVKRKVEYKESKSIPVAIAQSVVELVNSLNVKAIITPTGKGFTPTMISRFRPKVPILALVRDSQLMRKLSIVRGVIFFPGIGHSSINEILNYAVKHGLLHMDDLIILSYKNKVKRSKTTNSLEVRVIGEVLNPEKYKKDPTKVHKV